MAGDSDGYKRGAKGIDGNKTDDFKMPKSRCEFGEESDYGSGPVSHRLASLVESGGASESNEFATETQGNYFRPRALKGKDVGGTSPYKDSPTGYHDTHPVKAVSPTGKYAKKGGSGQRSGS